MPTTEIHHAATPELIDTARELFREYSLLVTAHVCFVDFAREVTGLPGPYGPPAGRLWVALHGPSPAGCVAVRPLAGPGVCEMKRLFVRESARGSGLGRRLVAEAVAWARAAGYREMRLDTIPALMDSAIALYESYGFRRISPYNDTPGAIHFSLAIE